MTSVTNQTLERSLLAGYPPLTFLKVGTPQIALPMVCAKNLYHVQQEPKASEIMTAVSGAVTNVHQGRRLQRVRQTAGSATRENLPASKDQKFASSATPTKKNMLTKKVPLDARCVLLESPRSVGSSASKKKCLTACQSRPYRL